MQVIIDQSQVAFRGLQRPVGQRLTRQAYPKTTELLFLAVQGHALNVFLVDHMGDGGCRSVAARDRRLRHGGLHNRRARAAVVAGTAGVQMLHVLDHLHLRRNHLQLPAHFRAHCMQPTRTLGTVLPFLRQRVMNLFGRHAFQNSAARAALLLALVRADRLQFGLFLLRLCLGFDFVEDELKLAGHDAFARTPIPVFPGQNKLLVQPLQLCL